MLLVIDVGNTNTVLGLYDGEKLKNSWRITTANGITSDEIGILLHNLISRSGECAEEVDDIIISSVVPNVMYSLSQGIRKYFGAEPVIVGSGMKTGIIIRHDNPRDVGADRIVNLVAAKELYGGPAIVIDYGTADTFDVLNADGEFITGFIAPGLQICAEALYKRAAQLPKIEIRRPKSIKARDTVRSIQIGLTYGHRGATRYIIKTLIEGLGLPDNTRIIATGGLARVIDDKNEIFDVLNPWLTLEGLRILHEKNKK